jgi:hypothetical protein
MTRELQLAFAGIPLMPPQEDLKARLPTKICLVGEHEKLSDDRAKDKITFLAMEGGQYLPDGGAHSGVVQVTYRVEEDPDSTSSENRTYYLIRDEIPYTRPFEKAYERRMTFPITKNLISLKFRYLSRDDKGWSDEWGKDELANLPRLVYFELQLRSPKGRILSYGTTVPFRSKP